MAIEIETRSNSRAARADLKKVEASLKGIQDSVNKTTASFASLATGIAAVASAAFAAKGLTTVSDSFTNLNNKIKVVTNSSEEFAKGLNNVKRIAISTRSNLNNVATLYGKVALAGNRFNASQRDIAAFTSTFTKSLAISGATAAEAASATLQLGQGLAANRFAGEELRAVFEAAPVFALELAKGMNVAFGSLRKLAEEGKLTFDTIFNAILKRQENISGRFKEIDITFAAAFTNLGNALGILFKEVSRNIFGEGPGLASRINEIALDIFEIAGRIDFLISNAKAQIRFFIFDVKRIFS